MEEEWGLLPLSQKEEGGGQRMPYYNLDQIKKKDPKYCVIFDIRERDLIKKLQDESMKGIFSDPKITYGRAALNVGDIMIGRLPEKKGEEINWIYIIERKEFKDFIATMTDHNRSENLVEMTISANARRIMSVLLLENMYKFFGSIRGDKDGNIKVPPKKYRRNIHPSCLIGYINSLSTKIAIWFSANVANTLSIIHRHIINSINTREREYEYAPRNPTDFIFGKNGIQEVTRGGGTRLNETYTAGMRQIFMGEKKRQSKEIEQKTITEIHSARIGILRTVKIYLSMRTGRQTIRHFSYHPPIDVRWLDPAIDDLSKKTMEKKDVILYEMQLFPVTSENKISEIIDMVCRLINLNMPTWHIKYEHLWIDESGEMITLTSFDEEDIDEMTTTMLTKTSYRLFKTKKEAEFVNMIGLCIAHELVIAGVDIYHLELDFTYEVINIKEPFHIGHLFIIMEESDFINMLYEKFNISKEDESIMDSICLIKKIIDIAEFGRYNN